MPILDWYLDDDLTTLDDEPIPGLAAGSYSDAVELHLWVDKGSPSPQPAANVRVVLDTEDPASAGTFRRSGLPPQDELWGWMRVVGFDNTGDPTWTIPATGWQPVGAYAALPLGTIPGDCAVHLEVRFRPPVSAPELAWRFRPGAIYDEYAQPVPPVVTALGSGVLTGVGDGTRFGVVSGLALTPSSPADDEVHVAAGVWLHRGALYAQVASDHQLDQDDGDSAALTSGESYWAALSGGAGTITVTKGLKGAAPAKPAPPAGEPLLGFVRVAYQAGGSEIASAHLDVSAVVADRYRCEADGLDVVISAGQALGGGTLRYHFGSTRLTLDPSTTSYLWQLTSGLFEITEDIADRPEPSALLFWEVETDASAVTAIHDHRRYAGRTVCLRLAGAAPVSPGFVADLQVEHPLLYVDEVVFRVSDNGSGSSGSTVGEWFVDGVTAYTSQATDDQRPEIAHDATVLATREGVAELRELRRGQVVSFETAAYPSGGKPERVELILVCREA
ncbi:MAG: hypothetical protein BWX64_00934 [Acidobacteria bacterium ADurb.Bin051]|jgi:hypothetical protein|nr:MAG: hypothetical protein BWX64_00934 [Acidobacteria bacterium ADurb.Bin051]